MSPTDKSFQNVHTGLRAHFQHGTRSGNAVDTKVRDSSTSALWQAEDSAPPDNFAQARYNAPPSFRLLRDVAKRHSGAVPGPYPVSATANLRIISILNAVPNEYQAIGPLDLSQETW